MPATSDLGVGLIFEAGGDEVHEDVPVAATTTLYEGDFVGDNAGYGRQLVAGDAFRGVCVRRATNQGNNDLIRNTGNGTAGNISANCRTVGRIRKTIAAADIGAFAGTAADEGSTVYAKNERDVSAVAGGNTAIGKVVRYVSGSAAEGATYVIAFEADSERSL